MVKAIVPRSAKPFNFQEAYKLSDETVSILITYVNLFLNKCEVHIQIRK